MKGVVCLSCMSLTSPVVSVLLILPAWWLWKRQCVEELSPFYFVVLKIKWQSKPSELVRLLVLSWSACLNVSGRLDLGREEWDLIPEFCGTEELLTFFIDAFSLKYRNIDLEKQNEPMDSCHSQIKQFPLFFLVLLSLLTVYFGGMVYPTVFRWTCSIVVLTTIEVIRVLSWTVKCLLKQGLLWKSRL